MTTTPSGGTPQHAEHAPGMEEGLRVLSYLVAGMLLYGFLGWLVDRWQDTTLFLPIGVVLGAAFSIYLIIRRYASAEAMAPTGAPASPPDPAAPGPSAPVPTTESSPSRRTGPALTRKEEQSPWDD